MNAAKLYIFSVPGQGEFYRLATVDGISRNTEFTANDLDCVGVVARCLQDAELEALRIANARAKFRASISNRKESRNG